MGFWIWDDPFYGWHAEVLYVPLAVLFAGALTRRRRQVLLWGAALVLLREDGAVVACAIHLLHTWLPGPEQVVAAGPQTDAADRHRLLRSAPWSREP